MVIFFVKVLSAESLNQLSNSGITFSQRVGISLFRIWRRELKVFSFGYLGESETLDRYRDGEPVLLKRMS